MLAFPVQREFCKIVKKSLAIVKRCAKQEGWWSLVLDQKNGTKRKILQASQIRSEVGNA